jgi:hypothetical protein
VILRALLASLLLGLAAAAVAQTATPQQPNPQAGAKPAAKPPAKAATKKVVRPTWAELTPGQQEVLAKLKPEWDRLDRDRRLKWVGIAKRYPTMTVEQQARVQRRMEAWVKLTPEQRRQARENYKHMAKVPADRRGDLRQQWAEYQALTPQEREGLVPPGNEAQRHRH